PRLGSPARGRGHAALGQGPVQGGCEMPAPIDLRAPGRPPRHRAGGDRVPGRLRHAAGDRARGRGGRRAGRDRGGAARGAGRPANAAHRPHLLGGATMTGGEEAGFMVMTMRDVMTHRLVTIAPETACDEARRLMEQHRIRHLPVVADGRLIGILSDRDVRSAAPGATTGRVMTPDPVTVAPEMRVEHAARVVLEGRFGSLPIVEDGALIGIVTYSDLLEALVQVMETATQERIAVDFSGGR